MKKLITILFLIPAMCWGQKMDTAYLGDAIIVGANIKSGTIIKQDTIPVLMLVCDTSAMQGRIRYGWKGDTVRKITDSYYRENVWWQLGYEVLAGYPVYALLYPNSVIAYLDKDKKPLPKSIVVFLTKEIK